MTGAHRIEVDDELRAAATLARPDSVSAFEVTVPGAASGSPERWARAVFEGAPAPVRWFLRVGWRAGLGFGLGPRGSADHVLGARIADTGADSVTLELRSRLCLAHNVFVVRGDRVRWVTLVRYHTPAARPLWTVAALAHRALAPRLLDRAAAPRRGPALLRAAHYPNAVLASLLGSPRWSRLVRGRMTMITYTGRRSGRTFSTPVAYRRHGDDVTIGVVAPDAKAWWRNFRDGGGPVSLLLDGADRPGHAVAGHDERGRVRVTVRLA
jgi:F420H(2)-dependent quinone reductase